MYVVNELYATLQGEGINAGRPAVLCRFAGCNLWTGRERDRLAAICTFCDTDFVGTSGPGGGRYPSAAVLADQIVRTALVSSGPLVVLTGGEPTLQTDGALVDELHRRGAEVAIETNGTRAVLDAIDWICVSPKAGAPLRQRHGDELKVVWPQASLDLESLAALPFDHHLLQPRDDCDRERNMQACVEICLQDGRWRLSVQMHKVVGLA
jgi:7-carboxy-7-deazaguanine synthase